MAKTKPKSGQKSAAKAGAVDWPGCQLMLTVQPGPGAVDSLRAALDQCEPAAILIRPSPDHQLGAGETKPLVDLAQDHGVAAILFGDVRLARTLRADGVHFGSGTEGELQAIIGDARATLGAAANIGIDAGISRHRAMEAGEAGADYVAFGVAEGTELARQARNDLVSWWAEIFEVPCVALDVLTADEAAAADGDGADFVAVTLPFGAGADAAAALLRDIDAVLQVGVHADG